MSEATSGQRHGDPGEQSTRHARERDEAAEEQQPAADVSQPVSEQECLEPQPPVACRDEPAQIPEGREIADAEQRDAAENAEQDSQKGIDVGRHAAKPPSFPRVDEAAAG